MCSGGQAVSAGTRNGQFSSLAAILVPSTNPFLLPIFSRAGIPKHPESSAVRSWKGGKASAAGIFLAVVRLLYLGRSWEHLLNETRYPGAPFLPVRRLATGTTFALRFLLCQK